MRFSELPEGIRVKLDEEVEGELWKEIDDIGGVKEFGSNSRYNSSDLYNWKNKDVFYPAEFVREVLGDEISEHVKAFKGAGRSLPVKNPVFPLDISDEFLTRIEYSVSVNTEGVPVYRANEVSLVERFQELLLQMGDVPVSVYNRSGYELRYPKYLHEIFPEIRYEEDFAALVDEEGRIENGKVVAGDHEVPLEEFEDRLYSRDKRLELAVERGDSEKVKDIIGGEVEKVRKAFG